MDYNKIVELQDGSVIMNREIYDEVYKSELPNCKTLDDVFARLNMGNYPNDYRGHSLSVSDIVKTSDGLFFVDSFGWKEVEFATHQNEYEELFDQFLELVEFSLIKYPDGMWSVYDKQGANLGGINGDTYKTAAAILDRMTIYIKDYFVESLEKCLEEAGHEIPDWKTFGELADYARPLLPDNKYCCDTLDMICRHADKINLENCFFETAEKFFGENYDKKNFNNSNEEM